MEVAGPQVVAVYPHDNENAWLLGFHAMRKDVGVVGAKGFEPVGPTPLIVLPESIKAALTAA